MPSPLAMEQPWTLVTGQPGCGKTTLVKALLEHLRGVPGVRVRGFYTDEVLKGNSRVGFDVVTADGARGVLSRKGGPSAHPKTGAYSVDVSAFDALALPSFVPEGSSGGGSGGGGDGSEAEAGKDVVVIDEIGRMELHSQAFRRAIKAMLRDPSTRVVGALTAPIYGHRVPFCDEIEQTRRVEVLRIKKSNRDQVRTDLLRRLVKEYGASAVARGRTQQKLKRAAADTPAAGTDTRRRRRLT